MTAAGPMSRSAGMAADRLLLLLKTRGPQTSAELGTALGITSEAARQQLFKLAGAGLAEPAARREGVGRPVQVWSLTALGNAQFPDGHADMAVGLIASIRQELGEAALARLIASREAQTLARYRDALAGAESLRDKVAGLAALRAREGYMAGWEEDEDGFLLFENHCPICAAAAACQGFCRTEIALFRQVLGPGTSVERTEHIQNGARRCTYRITITSQTATGGT